MAPKFQTGGSEHGRAPGPGSAHDLGSAAQAHALANHDLDRSGNSLGPGKNSDASSELESELELEMGAAEQCSYSLESSEPTSASLASVVAAGEQAQVAAAKETRDRPPREQQGLGEEQTGCADLNSSPTLEPKGYADERSGLKKTPKFKASAPLGRPAVEAEGEGSGASVGGQSKWNDDLNLHG